MKHSKAAVDTKGERGTLYPCCFCFRSRDPTTLLTIKGKKQTIVARLEAWYELKHLKTKPVLILIVEEKGAALQSKPTTESIAEQP